MKLDDYNKNLKRTDKDVRALTPSSAGAVEDDEKLTKRAKDAQKTIKDNARKAGMKPLEENRKFREARHIVRENFFEDDEEQKANAYGESEDVIFDCMRFQRDIYDRILEGSNADLIDNIKGIFAEYGGKCFVTNIRPDSFVINDAWLPSDAPDARNGKWTFYLTFVLQRLQYDAKRLTEDITMWYYRTKLRGTKIPNTPALADAIDNIDKLTESMNKSQANIRHAVIEALTKKYGKAPLKLVNETMSGDWKKLIKESVLSDRIRKGDLDYNEESDAWEATEGDTRVQFQDREERTTAFDTRKDKWGNMHMGRKLDKQPRVASKTWGRVWKGKDGEKDFKSFEGPKYKVRQDIARYLDEDMGDDVFVGRSYYDSRFRGLEDDIETNDYEELRDWIWEKVQNGAYVEADGIDGQKHRYAPDKVEWGDEAYDIDDYLAD